MNVVEKLRDLLGLGDWVRLPKLPDRIGLHLEVGLGEEYSLRQVQLLLAMVAARKSMPDGIVLYRDDIIRLVDASDDSRIGYACGDLGDILGTRVRWAGETVSSGRARLDWER
jgi:hypothetical protein